MIEFKFNNENLLNLINSKIKKLKVLPLPDAWLTHFGRQTKHNVKAQKAQLIDDIRESYKVDIDKLCYMVANELSSKTPYNPYQKENKWKQEVIKLPTCIGKFSLNDYECVFYGGTYKNFENFAERIKEKNHIEGEKIFNEQLGMLHSGQLIIISKANPQNDTVDLLPSGTDEYFERLNKEYLQYPLLNYHTKYGSADPTLKNILDNLVGENLVERGVITNDELNTALGSDRVKTPSKEVAKTREVKCVVKPNSKPQFNMEGY